MTDRRTHAILSSPGDWGVYGNAGEHERYMEPAINRRRRCSPCSRPRPAATHVGMCNGLALMSGCEWHVRKWVQGQEQG
jgi:hypothetical protein